MNGVSKEKRAHPDRVAPVTYDGIRYEGEETREWFDNEIINSGTDHVRAYDEKTGELLWDKQVYETHIDPDRETDVQWRFIEKLAIEEGRLVVTAERGAQYEVDPKTGKVLKAR